MLGRKVQSEAGRAQEQLQPAVPGGTPLLGHTAVGALSLAGVCGPPLASLCPVPSPSSVSVYTPPFSPHWAPVRLLGSPGSCSDALPFQARALNLHTRDSRDGARPPTRGSGSEGQNCDSNLGFPQCPASFTCVLGVGGSASDLTHPGTSFRGREAQEKPGRGGVSEGRGYLLGP